MAERLRKLNTTGVKNFNDRLFFPKHEGLTIHQIIYEEHDPDYILWLYSEGKCQFENEVLLAAEVYMQTINEENGNHGY
jgi:hypothetical protein